MKVVILCGGEGTRMKEETEFKPKPLVLVGGKPILWHIMKIYAHYGYNEFILALGYKGDMIKDYFLNQAKYLNDFTLDTKTNTVIFHSNEADNFKITFVETGPKSLTGERVRRVKKFIEGDDFMLTYGDGLADINIKELVEFHKQQGTVGTITGVRPVSRFGMISIDEASKKARAFQQSGVIDNRGNEPDVQQARADQSKDFVNGGFMIFKKEVFNSIEKDVMIEQVFLPLSRNAQLSVYEHTGQWKAMDTHKEVQEMNIFWQNDPFWKIWDESKA